jgi:hypothetical protein
MFNAKYSRLKFWIISTCLLIPAIILNFIAQTLESGISDKPEISSVIYLIALPFSVIWVNTLANRIRDFGGNPWYSLWSLVPIVNIIMSFYYGIIQYKNNDNNNIKRKSNNVGPLTKAVVNHAKDTACNIKPSLNEYVEKHSNNNCYDNIQEENNTNISDKKSTSNQEYDNLINTDTVDNKNEINENKIYEKVMIEIEEDKKVKSIWAKVFSQSDGDINKAQALYIKTRVNDIIIIENNRIKEENAKIKIRKDLDYKVNTEARKQEEVINQQNDMLKSMNFIETKKNIVEFYTNIGYFIKFDNKNSIMMKHNINKKSYILLTLNENKQEFKLDLFNVIYYQSQGSYSNTLLFKDE